jgi:hypothetical protein
MPIRAELRHHYGKIWRTVTRPRILARAGNKCEQCGKPNRRRLLTCCMPGRMYWSLFATRWRNHHGELMGFRLPPGEYRRVRIVLTVAHLNHVAGDDRDENLKALCQWCHLNYDLGHHHETRAARKDAARPLLNPTPTKEAGL